MDRSELLRLAEGGLAAFPPDGLGSLAEWTRDYCWASGAVAYCILHDLFEVLVDAFEGPVLSSTASEVDVVLRRDLRAIVEAEDPDVARTVALSLRSDVMEALRSQQIPGWN